MSHFWSLWKEHTRGQMFNFCPKINFGEKLPKLNLNFRAQNLDFDFKKSLKIAKIHIFIQIQFMDKNWVLPQCEEWGHCKLKKSNVTKVIKVLLFCSKRSLSLLLHRFSQRGLHFHKFLSWQTPTGILELR